jgi:hypothetical protein
MDEGDCDVDEVGDIVGSGMVGKRVSLDALKTRFTNAKMNLATILFTDL